MDEISLRSTPNLNEDISIFDVILRLRGFWFARRLLIVSLILGGISAGFIGQIFFNPWMVQLNIRNLEGIFELSSLRNILLMLKSVQIDELQALSDPIIAKKVLAKLETTNWMEQNIAPEYSISKTDLKASALPDQAQLALGADTKILYLGIKIMNSDAAEAEKETRLIADLVLRLQIREQLLGFFSNRLATSRSDYLDAVSHLAEARSAFAVTELHLALANKVSEKSNADGKASVPSQVSVQNQLSTGINDTVFLPLDRQLEGLQIADGLQEAAIDLWVFKKGLYNHIADRLTGAIDKLLIHKFDQKTLEMLAGSSYWAYGEFPQLTSKTSNAWMKQYAVDALEAIVYQTKTVEQRFNRLKNTPYLITVKPAYSMSMMLGLGLLTGLLGVICLLIFDLLRDTMRRRLM
jgi:hypothetical protein